MANKDINVLWENLGLIICVLYTYFQYEELGLVLDKLDTYSVLIGYLLLWVRTSLCQQHHNHYQPTRGDNSILYKYTIQDFLHAELPVYLLL